MALSAAGLVVLWKWNRWAAAVGAFAALLLLLALIGQPGRLPSNVLRIETWADAVRHLSLIGNGLGSFRFAYPEMEFAHNDFLQITYELGVPGLIVLSGLLFLGLQSQERPLLIAFMVEGFFGFPLYWPATGFFAAVCLGAALRRPCLYVTGDDGQCARYEREAIARAA